MLDIIKTNKSDKIEKRYDKKDRTHNLNKIHINNLIMNNMQDLINKFRQRKIDTIKVCYYPFCDNDSNVIMKLKNITSTHMKRIVKGIDIDQHINGKYTEYGIRDTFMRETDIITNGKRDKNRMFFRRETYNIRLNECSGVFVIELYTQCDEEDFPIIIEYPHYLQCIVDTYVIIIDNDILRMCFTKIEDAKCISSKGVTYLNICRDISVDETTDINIELNDFIKDVLSLRKSHDKLFQI